MAAVDFDQIQQQIIMLLTEVKTLRHDVAELLVLAKLPTINTSPPESEWLTKKEVCQLVKFSAAHVDRMEVAGNFPKRMKIGDSWRSRVIWQREDILAWMHSRKTNGVRSV